MVQTLEQEVQEDPASDTEPVEPASLREYTPGFHELNTFNYRPVPIIAVVGLMVSLLSFVAIFIWLALPLCVIGLVISALALYVIRSNRQVHGGTSVAVSGIVLSASFLAAGIGYQVYTYQTEVPEGYQRINFVQDISDKGFVTENGMMAIHPDVLALDGKEIFLKGFIYQTGKLHDLASFLLVKDSQACCFGGNPALTDRVGVLMEEGKAIDYKAGKVGLAGTFRINPNFTNDDLEPLYMLDGVYFTSRVSDF